LFGAVTGGWITGRVKMITWLSSQLLAAQQPPLSNTYGTRRIQRLAAINPKTLSLSPKRSF